MTPAALSPSAWSLAWRQTLRDFRAGELRLLVVAVKAVSANYPLRTSRGSPSPSRTRSAPRSG